MIPQDLLDRTQPYTARIQMCVNQKRTEVLCFLYCVSGYVLTSKIAVDDDTQIEKAKTLAEGKARLKLKDFLDFLEAHQRMHQ